MRELNDAFFQEQAAIAGFEHRGLVIDHLLGSETRTQHGKCLSAAESTRFFATQFANLLPGEYPLEALVTTSAVNYVGQVRNGGHGQYFGNAECNPWELDACENGLSAIGASEHLSLFRRARTLIDSDLDQGYRIAAGGGFGEVAAEVREVDLELLALHKRAPLYPLIERWLEGRIVTRVTAEPEFQSATKRFVQSHPEFVERGRIKEERRRSFAPGYAQKLYFDLCVLAGVEFEREATPMWRSLRLIRHDLSDRPELVTGFETSAGDFYMFLLHEATSRMQFRAALYKVGSPSRLAEIEMPEKTFRHFRQAMR